MFWTLAWKLLTGNIAGIVTSITGYLGKANDNEAAKLKKAIGADRDVAIAQLQASANAYHDRVDLFKGLKVIQWLIAAALIPPVIHSGAIYLDSTFCNDIINQCTWLGEKLNMPWRVPKAPPPYDEREWLLISSLLGIQGGVTVGLGMTRMLMRK